MENKELKAHVAVISHKRPQNVKKIMEIVGDCTFYVNDGEGKEYLEAGALDVQECGTNICQARNKAIKEARMKGLPSIQVSDDLKSLKRVKFDDEKKHLVYPVEFNYVCETMLKELNRTGYIYGGVAVTTNRLNYTGDDFSYDKLIVCDLVCIMPHENLMFDENMALKEDYDFTITNLLEVGGVVRCNQFLCDFPHRDNVGGANTYRNNDSEKQATERLLSKRAGLIKKHPTREGQISLNYQAIQKMANGQENLFD